MPENQARRDRLAELCGYKRFYALHGGGTWTPPWDSALIVQHPFPDGDLTALAAVWPEGWAMLLNRHYHQPNFWHAMARCLYNGPPLRAERADAPTEYDARLDLTIAVLEQAHA